MRNDAAYTVPRGGLHGLAFAVAWFLVFSVPWANMVLLPGIGTISRFVGLLTLAVGMFVVMYYRTIRFHPAHVLMLVFGIWLGVTYFWSVDPEQSYIALKSYLQFIIIVWIIYQIATRESEIIALLSAYVLGACVAAAGTVVSYLAGGGEISTRFAAEGYNPNDLAYILTLAIPMAWYLAARERKPLVTWLYRLYPFLGLYAVLLTGSRGGSVVAVAIILFQGLLTFPNLTWRLKLTVPLLAVGLLAYLISFVPMESVTRILSLGAELTGGDLNARTGIWSAGLEVLGNASLWGAGALFGVGAGAFKAAVAPYFGVEVAPHNVYLSILVEAGAVGFILFAAILLLVMWQAARLPRDERLLWLSVLLVWLIAAFVANWEWRKETWLLFGLLVTHASALGMGSERATSSVTAQTS